MFLVMDESTWYIQNEMSWFMLVAKDIIPNEHTSELMQG